ncbi:hypothetical protein R80B4_01470 [Fibrobacteres bacterium R8-0-B4]
MKRIFKILIPVAVLGAVAVGGYFYYKGSIAYTAVSINSAIKNHDWDKFTEFVDVDAVYDSVMTRLVGESDLARGISAAMKETTIDGLKEAIAESPSDSDSVGISVGDIYSLLKIVKTSSRDGLVIVDIPLETKDLNINVLPEVEIPNTKITITLTLRKGNGHLVLCGIGTDLDNENIMALGEALLGSSVKGIF